MRNEQEKGKKKGMEKCIEHDEERLNVGELCV